MTALLDRAVAENLPRAVDVLRRLVSEPSTVGQEQGAQDVLAEQLEQLGFAVVRLPVPQGIVDDPLAGVPLMPYTGRYDIVAERGTGDVPSLLINGHMDVVPAETAHLWTTAPFEPTVVDGWLRGRGAADMKGGFAAGLLALWALDATRPGWLNAGRLTWVAAIEEEYTGNGTVGGGDWISSVPAVARLGVRVGHPRTWTSDDAFDRVRTAVLSAVADDPWLAEHPPVLRMNGFRAEGYAQDPDTPLVRALVAAHREVHGTDPALVSVGSTTDARLYVNRFGVPAAAYGPRTRNMHGTDEAVELDSIAVCAAAVARFLLSWFR